MIKTEQVLISIKLYRSKFVCAYVLYIATRYFASEKQGLISLF